MSSGKFLYFAYGSNLLQQRLRLHNPSAVYKCVARLEGYYFHFCGYGKRWNGAAAAIHERPGSHVWGVVWELDDSDKEHLDHQERSYTPIQVDVMGTDKQVYHCRTYYLDDRHTTTPSPHYKEVILTGARQHNLPDDYINFLESFADNGFQGEVKVYDEVMAIYHEEEQMTNNTL